MKRDESMGRYEDGEAEWSWMWENWGVGEMLVSGERE